LVRLQDTGVYYIAIATGSGADKWQVFNSIATASTTGAGAVELATNAEAVTGTDTARAVTPAAMKAGLASEINARGAEQALVADGTAAAGTIADATALATGLFDFSWFQKLSLADYTPSAAKPLATKFASNLGWKFWLLTTGVLRLEIGNGSDFTTYRYDSTIALTVSDGEVVRVGFTADRDGNVVFYQNGAQLGDAVAISGAAAQTSTSTGSLLIGSDDSTHTAGTFYAWHLYNRLLTAPEVLSTHLTGAPAASDYPTGGAGVEQTTVTADVGSPTVTDIHTFTFASGESQSVKTSALTWATAGARYRIKGTAASVTGTLSVYFPGLAIGTITTDGAFSFEGQFASAPASNLLYVSNTSDTGTGAITAFSVVGLGLLLAPEANAPGAGPQRKDVSGNNAHLNLPGDGVTGGVTHALPGAARCDFGETRVASGYALGRDAVVIPAGYRIARIWCSGNGTFSIGNAASGTEVVNAFTATSTTQPATLAAYTTSSRKLYITLGTATSLTYNVQLERI